MHELFPLVTWTSAAQMFLGAIVCYLIYRLLWVIWYIINDLFFHEEKR